MKAIKRHEGESLKLNNIRRGNRLYFTVSAPPPPPPTSPHQAINNDWFLNTTRVLKSLPSFNLTIFLVDASILIIEESKL